MKYFTCFFLIWSQLLIGTEYEVVELPILDKELTSDRVWVNEQGVVAGRLDCAFRWSEEAGLERFDSWRDNDWLIHALGKNGEVVLKLGTSEHVRVVEMDHTEIYLLPPNRHVLFRGEFLPGHPYCCAMVIDYDRSKMTYGMWDKHGHLTEFSFPDHLKMPCELPYRPYLMRDGVLLHGAHSELFILNLTNKSILCPTVPLAFEGIEAAGGTLITGTTDRFTPWIWDLSWEEALPLLVAAPTEHRIGWPMIRGVNSKNQILVWEFYFSPSVFVLSPNETGSWDWEALPDNLLKPLALSDSGHVVAITEEGKVVLLKPIAVE